MLVIVKHFYETNENDFAYFDVLWKEQENRMIFLPMHLNETRQAIQISKQIIADPSKDILAIRFSSFIERNSIFRQIKKNFDWVFWETDTFCANFLGGLKTRRWAQKTG